MLLPQRKINNNVLLAHKRTTEKLQKIKHQDNIIIMADVNQIVIDIMANNALATRSKAKSILLLGLLGEAAMHANHPPQNLVDCFNQLKEGLFSSSQPPRKDG